MTLTPSEREELEAGIASGFWAAFRQHAEREWGAGGERYRQAVQNAASMKDEHAVHTLRMIIFTQQEIERLFAWPKERLAQLTRHAPNPDGYQSRRGGL